jgi:hypothetical protein
VGGQADGQALSLSPSRTLVTPYCKRIRPGRRTTRATVPLIFPPCVPSRADPSGLGHAATIYSSVQGPPRGRNADKYQQLSLRSWKVGVIDERPDSHDTGGALMASRQKRLSSSYNVKTSRRWRWTCGQSDGGTTQNSGWTMLFTMDLAPMLI